MSKRKSEPTAEGNKRVKLEDEVDVSPVTTVRSAQRARAAEPTAPKRPVSASNVPQRKVSELFNDPEADFEIISKDDISIRVHSYILLANSSRFRSILVGPNVENPFHMRSYSTRTLEDLLTVMHGKPLWPLNDDRLLVLIDAAQRLECPVVLEHIKAKIRETLGQKGTSAWNLFIAGAKLNCPETCRRAIPYAAAYTWYEYDDGKELRGLKDRVPRRCVLDIRTMPESVIKQIPFRYFLALGRAMLLRDEMRIGKEDWKKIADEFHRLLEEKD